MLYATGQRSQKRRPAQGPLLASINNNKNLKINNMNFQECPHYDEILKVLTEGRNFEDINFEIDEIKNCKECSKERSVCELWTTLILVEHMKPQMNISDAKATIDNLNEQLGRIAIKLTRNSKTNDSDNKVS